ncbi:MAG: hypothetical protein ABJN36_06375 [Cyclobacteriaceae bacterium]
MLDRTFKELEHNAEGFKITLTGGELSKGYKPDVVLMSQDGYIILESEHSTSRKLCIGALIKAAKLLTGDRKGYLVIVLREAENTTAKQIAKHLAEYLNWIRPLSNVIDVYVISDENYCAENNVPIKLLGNQFLKASYKV